MVPLLEATFQVSLRLWFFQIAFFVLELFLIILSFSRDGPQNLESYSRGCLGGYRTE